jgi:hypothetical protein
MRALAVLTVLSMCFLAACDRQPSAVPDDPSFAADVLPVFNSNCASCHSGSTPTGSYPLTTYAGAMSVGSDSIANVIAGSADSSLLYRRVTGEVEPRMPLGGAPLDTVPTGTVRNWINRGARDN